MIRSLGSRIFQPWSAAAEFWSGLLAGAVQKTVKELALHPLDTAKARQDWDIQTKLQTSHSNLLTSHI